MPSIAPRRREPALERPSRRSAVSLLSSHQTARADTLAPRPPRSVAASASSSFAASWSSVASSRTVPVLRYASSLKWTAACTSRAPTWMLTGTNCCSAQAGAPSASRHHSSPPTSPPLSSARRSRLRRRRSFRIARAIAETRSSPPPARSRAARRAQAWGRPRPLRPRVGASRLEQRASHRKSRTRGAPNQAAGSRWDPRAPFFEDADLASAARRCGPRSTHSLAGATRISSSSVPRAF